MNLNLFQSRSLKTRITLFTLTIFVLSVWALAFYASRTLHHDMQDLLSKQQFSSTSFIAAEVNQGLQDRLRGLEKVAQTLSPAILGNSATLQKFLEERPVLEGAFNAGVIVLDPDGTVIAEVPRSAGRIGTNYMDRDHIIGALKEGKTMIGRPIMGRTLRVPLIAMATPIRDAQGKIIGALSGATNLAVANFLNRISEGSFGQSGGYFLNAPQYGLVVTSSIKSRIMAALPAPGVSPILDRYERGHEGTDIFIDPRGVEVLSSVKSVPVAGWYVAVQLSTAEAFAPIDAMQQRLLLATLLLTLLAGALTWWMLRRQLSPLDSTVKTLATLSATEQALQVLPITSQDEIGQLIGGFNRLLLTLNHRETLLKQIFDTASVAIFLIDRGGRITQANQRMVEMFGSTLETLVGSEYFAMVHPSEREVARQNTLALLSGAIPSVDLDRVYWRADQTQFWGHLTCRSFLDANGAGRILVCVIADISVRKAQQTQLQLAAQVLEQSREGITMTDANCNIIMVNHAFTEITGYTEAEMLGKNPRVLSSGRHDQAFYQAMWNDINSKDCWVGEIWDRRKDGTVFPEWMTISALRDEQGQITHYLGNFSDLSNAKAAENRIQWLSHFDALTGLPNRTLLRDRTTHCISMAQRANEPVTMMLMGIDHFKAINDTLGHEMGDELLIAMAKRLSDAVRDQDTVARLGGKEFVLVLPGTPASGAAHLATGLLSKLAQPYQLGSHELTLTASIGIASYPDNGRDFDSLFKAVEIAMHRAQANGRGTFQFYSDEMFQQVLAREHLVNALRNAAALDQLQLVYQPLVDLQTGQISGLEALLRWQHPELGAISPVQFIPLAEESGLIKGLGDWVLRRACRDIRTWLDKGIQVPHVAVNVSPLQFRDPDLIAQVKSALSSRQIDPRLVYLEVTESALMDDVHRSEAMLRELKDLGVKLSLDDFGTGYSSLSYLKRFPFDKVKIDQSFVRDITTSQSDNVIVKVIVSMAHGLGLKVIAEGVETEAQCEIMRTSGCDEIQGYYFSKPISAQAIEELFTEGRQLPPHLLRLQKPQRTLLLVDDEPNIVAALKRLFRRDGHLILTANSGAEGLEVLSKHKVDIIISDQRMPGMTGVEFLRAAKIAYPDTIRIVLSGYTELQSVTDAINEGAVYRFLTKPWEDEQLREQIHKAFEYTELLEENRQLDVKIRTTNQELVAANRQLGDVLQKTRHQIERDETSLAIAREALQHIPLPVIGVDDEGLMAFVNAAAQRLFARAGPLEGEELAYVLPAIDAAIAAAIEGVPCELLIDSTHYRVEWNSMGASSRSRGKIVTLNKVGPNS
ncbi:EAL domain-containing protein [Rhodoferax sp. UBA5149]|uniref:EAL domain-containing protein n=1 Tax=Rhodoferax sp. UBA5149 TaxID=1947379 RepID=UPI0025FF7F1D|nr:EAL domain-containing protein [Rhodoferax sp. UBA5149]